MRRIVAALFLGLLATLAVFLAKSTVGEVVESPSATIEAAEEVPSKSDSQHDLDIRIVESQPELQHEPEVAFQPWTDEEAVLLTKMLWGEARGVRSDTEKAACVWCALNRVDQGYGDITIVVTAPRQFVGYAASNPVDNDLKALCEDVLSRWYAEKEGQIEVGRVLPADYLWFSGDGERNHFRNAYRGGDQWDWSLPSPYES